MIETLDKLEREIEDRKKEYKTDSYAMSIGELVNMYRDKDIIENPILPRVFRWTNLQKSNLIESILLGIPLPQIFVYQLESGQWEVIDGVQRLYTLLEFMGFLENHEPLQLVGTEQLPSLEGLFWEKLPQKLRLDIKRARVTIEIIYNDSDKDAKFEVFQRLNANSSHLSEQEIRNSLLVMINKDFFFWIKELSKNPHFQACVNVSERLEQEQYYMELVLRYLVLLHFEANSKELNSIHDFITQKMKILARKEEFSFEMEREKFNNTFKFIENTQGKNTFRRYNLEKSKYIGGFLESVYDPILIGIASNISDYDVEKDEVFLKEKIQNIWQEDVFLQNSKPSTPLSQRLPKLLPFAKEYFKKNG